MQHLVLGLRVCVRRFLASASFRALFHAMLGMVGCIMPRSMPGDTHVMLFARGLPTVLEAVRQCCRWRGEYGQAGQKSEEQSHYPG